MKRFTLYLFGVLAMMLVWSTTELSAQSTQDDDVIVVQEVTHKDGAVTVKKKRIEKGQNIDAYLKALDLENSDGAHVNVRVLSEGGSVTIIDSREDNEKKNGETVFFFRRGQEEGELKDLGDELETLRITLDENFENWNDEKTNQNFDFNFNFDNDFVHEHQGKKRALLGVYPDEGAQVEGIRLNSIVRGSGSDAAGLQGGDVLLAINGNALGKSSSIRSQLATFSPGDEVTVTYLRNGQTSDVAVILSESSHKSSYNYRRDPCKVFIGIYTSGRGHGGKGVRITGIIDDTPAAVSAIRGGDVVLAMDDVPVNSHNELLVERNKHNPGDYFMLTILRDGQIMDVDAQFKSCDQPMKEVVEEPIEETLVEEVQEELPIQDNTLELIDMKAFPNPTWGDVNVQFRAEQQPISITITDLAGKEVYSETINNFDGLYNKEIDIRNGAPGAMSLTIRQEGKVYTETIILLNKA